MEKAVAQRQIEEESNKEFKQQINPETTEFECFFHYTDEKLFHAGFEKGIEYAQKLKTDE
jgi:hypothetical protein